MTELLRVDELTVRFGTTTVVDGVTFHLHRGECLALVGESGSGKSVTTRTMVGLPGRGATVRAQRLEFDGADVTRLREREWRHVRGDRIGFVLQDALSSLDPLRPVEREIAEPLRLHTALGRRQRAAKVRELLTAVGVGEPEVRAAQYPHQLSGGLRQRALIASAIACDPELLLADEPTTALDATVAVQVLDLLGSLKDRHTGLLIVSHDLAVVSRLADRVAVMRNGRIVEQGPVEEVLQNPQHEYTKALLAAVPSAKQRPARPAAEPLIEVTGLRKAFAGPDGKPRTAVADVSFTLGAGETLGIVGESGSGKTTTARIAVGLEKPDAGTVRIGGADWAALSAAELRLRRRRVQIIYQDPLSSFDPRYVVERVIGEALGVAGYPRGPRRRARTVELLELVALDESFLHRRPLEMSGGQRQRVAIARALAAEPEVIVCDEPVSALDVSVQAQILDLLADLQRRLRVSYLFISHDLGVVHQISDRVLVMRDGVVLESGDVRQVFATPRHEYTRELLSAIPRISYEIEVP